MQLLLPVAEALKRCWRDTDALFAHITDWTAQPIGLRHPFAFYYGHMSAFLRLKVLPHVPPTALDTMLSRGVDPIVLDPTQCHSHPEVPATWPSKPELEQYTAAVRADIMRLVQAASAGHGGPLDMHALVMALEHEHMHQETLTYMVAQQRRQDWEAGTPRAVIKNTKAIAAHGVNGHANGHSFSNGVVDEGLKPLYFARCSYVAQGGLVANGAASNGVNGHHADFVTLPSGSVTLGLDPAYPRGYVWDNELGTRGPIDVKSVSVGRRAITVAEFMRFVKEGKGYGTASFWRPEEFAYLQTTKQCMPATWSLDASGEVYVHMPEGTFHWTEVSTCPVYASLAEARACAAWLGGRIMTEAEHHHATLTAADEIADLNCGGWEWTCSPLEPFDGFQADPLYPEYSTDFFDDCHFVLRGASPYTHPSMKRATFRNFYQPLYGYVFAKFRIVKDL